MIRSFIYLIAFFIFAMLFMHATSHAATCTSSNAQTVCAANYPNAKCSGTWTCVNPGNSSDCTCNACPSGYFLPNNGLGGCYSCTIDSSYANCSESGWSTFTEYSDSVQIKTRKVKVCTSSRAACDTEKNYRCAPNYYNSDARENFTSPPTCTACPEHSACPNPPCACGARNSNTCGGDNTPNACKCNPYYTAKDGACIKDGCDTGYYSKSGSSGNDCERCPTIGTNSSGNTQYGSYPGAICKGGVEKCCYALRGTDYSDAVGNFDIEDYCQYTAPKEQA